MDIATAQAHLDAWLKADLALSKGLSYSVDGLSVTRADTQSKIEYWQRRVCELSTIASGGRQHRAAVATFNYSSTD